MYIHMYISTYICTVGGPMLEYCAIIGVPSSGGSML
jgi:hypothetical protein